MNFLRTARNLQRDGQRLRKKEEAIYNAIKEKPDLAPVSKKLATRSIVFSVLSIVTIVLSLVGVYLALTKLSGENILGTLLLAIPVGAVAIYLIALFIIKAIISLVYQFKLNKKAHTWWALALVILPAIVLIVGICILITALAKSI